MQQRREPAFNWIIKRNGIQQPRIEYWYKVNKKRGTLPPHLRDASLLDVYDYCHASCRYFLWTEAWLKARHTNVEVSEVWLDDKRLRRTWHTPAGTLTEVLHYDAWNISAHHVEYRLKTPDDFRVLRFMLENETWYWDDPLYQQYMAEYNGYGVPMFYYRRSPVQRLFIEDMGFQNTIYFIKYSLKTPGLKPGDERETRISRSKALKSSC